MKNLIEKNKGFTLMELITTVAIFAILIAISYPQYKRFLLNSKTSEARVNIKAIRSLEATYKSEKGGYLTAGPSTINGGNIVGPTSGDFGPGPDNNSNQIPDFDELGFTPLGKVYYTYMVITSNNANSMAIDARGDLDGDEAISYFTMNSDGETPGGRSNYAPPEPFVMEKSGDDF